MNAVALLALSMAIPAPPQVGRAREPSAEIESLLKKMRTAYQAVRSASMQIKVKQFAVSGVRNGIISFDYEAPNKIRFVSHIGLNRIRRYSNGAKVVTLVGNQLPAVTPVVNVFTLGGRMPGNLEWLCFFDWKRQLSTSEGNNMYESELKLGAAEKWNGKNWLILDEVAPKSQVQVRYFIEPRTYLIWRCDITNLISKRKTGQTEVANLTLGVKLDSATFEPPRS
jgi:hypothetical protein